MKYPFVSVVLAVITTSFLPVMARAQISGCLIASSKTVYTETENVGLINAVLAIIFGSVQAYKSSPSTSSTTACMSGQQTVWVAGSTPCRVCPSGYNVLNLVTGCNGSSLEGFVASPRIVACNLDDYSWALGTAAGIFGLIIIRRKNLLK